MQRINTEHAKIFASLLVDNASAIRAYCQSHESEYELFLYTEKLKKRQKTKQRNK